MTSLIRGGDSADMQESWRLAFVHLDDIYMVHSVLCVITKWTTTKNDVHIAIITVSKSMKFVQKEIVVCS